MARGLGKGVGALFESNNIIEETTAPQTLKISEIMPNKGQPRKNFDPEAMQQLADSILEHGVIQPIVVRPIDGKDGYQIIAGERRFRASQMAGLNEIPVVVKNIDDVTMMELALIENLQREGLNPIEEADGYNTLIEKFGLTQENVAKRIGKSRSSITNTLRLLNLPEKVIEHVQKGDLSSGHARALLPLDDEKTINTIADKVIKEGLNVRQVEKIVKLLTKDKNTDANKTIQQVTDMQNSYFKEVELSLCDELNRKVKVNFAGEGKGTIQLSFENKEDLEDIVKIFNKSINTELDGLDDLKN